MKTNQPPHRAIKWGDIFLRGLAPQLLTTIILPLSILLIFITFGGLKLHQNAMRELARERDAYTANALAVAIESQLQLKAEVLRALYYGLINIGEYRDEGLTLLSSKTPTDIFDTGIAWINNQGTIISSSSEFDKWNEEINMGGILAGINQSKEQKSLPLLVDIRDNETQSPIIWMVAALEPDNGILIGSFSLSEMIAPIVKSTFPEINNNVLYVVDARRKVLYQYGTTMHDEFPENHIPELSDAMNQRDKTLAQDSDGEHVIGSSLIPMTGWMVTIEEPWESVASPVLRITENAPLVLVPIAILAILALWLASRRIIQPLQALETQAAQLGRGNFNAIEKSVGGILEIQSLQNELIKLARTVHASQQGLRNYINAITLGQEEERRRLARELHDETLQSLIALNQRIQLILFAIEEGKTDGLNRMIAEIQQLNSQNIQNLRRIAHGLRPIYLEELGLFAALEMLAREVEKNGRLTVEFSHVGSTTRLPPHIELALYRMAQEAMNNIVKHAMASRAWITVENKADQIVLEIRDNGKGFRYTDDHTTYLTGGHYGLHGLHERAEMIGAHVEINSEPSKGTCVRILLNHPSQYADVDPM